MTRAEAIHLLEQAAGASPTIRRREFEAVLDTLEAQAYSNGESSGQADYFVPFDDLVPDSVNPCAPSQLAAYVRPLRLVLEQVVALDAYYGGDDAIVAELAGKARAALDGTAP